MRTSIQLYDDVLVPSPMELGVFVKRSFAKRYWELKRLEFEVLKKLDAWKIDE